MGDEGQRRVLDIQGMHKLWDASEEVRQRLRAGLGILHEATGLSIDNNVSSLNSCVLRPILIRMASDSNRKLPSVNDLRTELAALFETNKRVGEEVSKHVATQPVHIRKLLSFVKAKVRRQEVSQDLWLHLIYSLYLGPLCVRLRIYPLSNIAYSQGSHLPGPVPGSGPQPPGEHCA